MAPTLDIGLIVVACIIPFVLVFFNLIVMAHFIDPEAAAGHVVAKFAIVSGLGDGMPATAAAPTLTAAAAAAAAAVRLPFSRLTLSLRSAPIVSCSAC